MTFFSWHESESISRSVLSDFLRPHGLWPTRFLCPWNSPGKNTGVVAISFSRGSLQTEPQGKPLFSWLHDCGEGNGTPFQYSCLENPMDRGAWQASVHGVAKSRTQLSAFTFTFHLHALEKEMATHASVLAWRIPGMGEPGGLPSTGLHRVGHD